MEYLTIEEYRELGGTNEVSPKILLTTKEKINELTFNRIVDLGFNNLTTFQQEKIKQSMFLLIDYYIENPEVYENGGSINSYSVGDISVSLDTNSKGIKIIDDYGVPLNVYNTLKQTGLTRRGF